MTLSCSRFMVRMLVVGAILTFSLIFSGCGSSGQETAADEPVPLLRTESTPQETAREESTTSAPTSGTGAASPEAGEADEPEYASEASQGGGDQTYDATDSIGVAMPGVWSDRRLEEVWVFGGEAVGPGMTASANLSDWEDTGLATGGLYMTASSSLASLGADGVLDSDEIGFSDTCASVERQNYGERGYSGRLEIGTNCRPNGKTILNLAASPESGECMAFLQVGYTTDEEKLAAEEALRTFDVDCRSVSEVERGLEDYVVPEVEEVEEIAPVPEVPAAVDCGGFASQMGAQQYYDYSASAEERVLLDPDGNGFACDIELLGYPLEYAEPEIPVDPYPDDYVVPDDGNPNTLENTCEGIISQTDYEECAAQQEAAGNPTYTD